MRTINVNVEGFSAVLWQRLLPGYVVLREAWWAAATLKGVDRQLNHVHELVAEQMRFLPGHAVLFALLLLTGNARSRGWARGLVKFDHQRGDRDDSVLTARVRSASWDLFFAHLSEWIHVEATGKGQATAVLTGDKRLGELRAMTSWAGKAPGGWGFQRVEFSDLFAPASLPRAVQWLEELNSSVERRAAAGTLVADRNRMLDWMADYLLRTHDPEWTQLLEDGPSVAYD